MYSKAKTYSTIGLLSLFFSCNTNEKFLNTKLQIEQNGSCETVKNTYKLTSNTAGERYEFDCCLSKLTNEKDATIKRNGDTVILSFPVCENPMECSNFNITFDVDAKPAYKFVKLQDKLVAITETKP